MKRVILTGADGFVGRQAILPLLSRGFDVHAVSNKEPAQELRAESVVWHRCDLLDDGQTLALVRRVSATHLLHFAWYVEHGKFWNAPENEFWRSASLSLFRAFSRTGGERIVAAGTCAEYDWQTSGKLSEHTTALNPQNLYGRSKHELREILEDLAISSAWGRIFFLYGEYEQPGRLVASVVRALLKNQFADCSAGNQIRDFLYVRDVADAFAALLDSDVEGPVNIASGVPVSIRELVSRIAEIIGNPDKVRFGALAGSANEPERIVADVGRLNNEVEWSPSRSLMDGLTSTINWWKES